jgi:hypothetical protein
MIFTNNGNKIRYLSYLRLLCHNLVDYDKWRAAIDSRTVRVKLAKAGYGRWSRMAIPAGRVVVSVPSPGQGPDPVRLRRCA